MNAKHCLVFCILAKMSGYCYNHANFLVECTPGTFGENCDKKCRCENGAVCDAVSGRCPGKCIPGYEGTDCSRKGMM